MMKTKRTLTLLLILALLLSSVPTTGLGPTQAAEPQGDAAATTHVVEALNTLYGPDATERPSPDLAVGEPVEVQDRPFSLFSGPSVPSEASIRNALSTR